VLDPRAHGLYAVGRPHVRIPRYGVEHPYELVR
jgi:hypothetical protein